MAGKVERKTFSQWLDNYRRVTIAFFNPVTKEFISFNKPEPE
jgi:hypothetical protein